jgi:hypothetical protein
MPRKHGWDLRERFCIREEDLGRGAEESTKYVSCRNRERPSGMYRDFRDAVHLCMALPKQAEQI